MQVFRLFSSLYFLTTAVDSFNVVLYVRSTIALLEKLMSHSVLTFALFTNLLVSFHSFLSSSSSTTTLIAIDSLAAYIYVYTFTHTRIRFLV